MRFVAAFVVLAALTASGCFGSGCFPDSYRLVWIQPDVAHALAARATAEAIADGSLQYVPADALLPVDARHLPVADGNASLLNIRYDWGGQWPGSLALEAGRGDGAAPVLRGTYDTGDRKATVRDHFEDLVAAFVDASDAERAAAVTTLLEGWDPLSNEVTHRAEAPAPGTLRTDAFFTEHPGAWRPDEAGHWHLRDGDWDAHAVVTLWRLTPADGGQLSADAAGAVSGPALQVDRSSDEAEPPLADLQDLTRQRFAVLGLPEPSFNGAEADVASRICVDALEGFEDLDGD